MDDIKKILGKRIRELRKRNGLTQEELSEIIGIEARNLLKIENAQTFPRATTLDKLINALNVTPQELFFCEHLDEIEFIRKKVISEIKSNDTLTRLIYKIIC